MKKFLFLSALGLAISGSVAAQDYASLQGRTVDVQIISDTNGPLPIYSRYGKNYVPGAQGERYSLYLHNNTPRRVLAVVSIDGVNVVSGQDASLYQQGYVLGPGQTSKIDGWRKSNSQVARFYFSSPSASYANRTGRSENIGVIGVAVFNEARPVPAPRPYARAAQSAPASDASAAAAETMSAPSLGTGHGEREYSYVNETYFQRANSPVEVLRIEYDTWRVLNDKGIIPRGQRLNQRDLFPVNQYVPDPPMGRMR